MQRHLTMLVLILGTLLPAVETFAQQSYRNLTVLGEARRYLLYLPTGFDPSQNLPVMMWFHGGGGSASGGVVEADFRSLADTERFIVVYGESVPDVLEGCRCWGYDGGGYANGNFEKDMAYVSAVIDDVVATYNADRRRIYGGGYSMGGSFSWDLACIKADEFAGLAPVAASCYDWTFNSCDSAPATTIYHLLGTNDFYAPYNGSPGWVPSAAQQQSYWIAKNQTETTPDVANVGGNITRYTWAPGEGCHGYQHDRKQGGGHDTPTASQVVAIWNYLSQFDIDGLITCNPIDPPANDECSTALDVAEGATAFSTEAATDSGVPSAIPCSGSAGPQVGSDIWFSFVVPCTGTVEISTCGADFDSRFDVYAGGCPSGSTAPYTCADEGCGDDAIVSTLALEGQTLLIRVGSSDGATGTGVLSIDCSPLVQPDPADLNGDGCVDAMDLGMVLAGWGGPGGDANGDGTTDAADIGVLLASWGC